MGQEDLDPPVQTSLGFSRRVRHKALRGSDAYRPRLHCCYEIASRRPRGLSDPSHYQTERILCPLLADRVLEGITLVASVKIKPAEARCT